MFALEAEIGSRRACGPLAQKGRCGPRLVAGARVWEEVAADPRGWWSRRTCVILPSLGAHPGQNDSGG